MHSAGHVMRELAQLREELLSQRGISEAIADHFFLPDYASTTHDPLLLHDVPAAVERIFTARDKRERVLVWGDYDADGITATAILMTVLQGLGVAVTPYLPHRTDDGYALNSRVLQDLSPHFDLLISADCGVSNGEEITWLKGQGKDVIVVDHHELPERLPPADAILHPRLGEYPFAHLSGAGVAWKLSQAILRDPRSKIALREEDLLDLAALGTIGDVVPLLGENRAIVTFGLKRLSRPQRAGVAALCRTCRLSFQQTISAKDVAFRIVPHLNAAGRMDHSQPALDLLLAHNEDEAHRLAQKLSEYNQERQVLTRRMMAEAERNLDLSLPFVFSANLAWRAGIVGLAAGRLADQYGRPAIVVGGNGKAAVGSARAPAGMNVLELLSTGKDFLTKLGGHERAAGFSLNADQISSFREALAAGVTSEAPPETLARLGIHAELDPGLLSWDLLELVESFEPYGEGNPRPQFLVRGMRVLDTRTMGKSSEHVRLMLAGEAETVEAVGFRKAKAAQGLGERVDIVGSLEANEYRGQRRLQFVIEDLAPAGTVRVENRN